MVEMISNIDVSTYAYFEEYNKKGYHHFTKTSADGKYIDFHLSLGDVCLMKKLPELVKEFVTKKLKTKTKKDTAKRKFQEINNDDSNDLNIEPAVKKSIYL